MTVFDQAGFDARLEWGVEGAGAVAAWRQRDLPHDLLACASGRELAALGRASDVHLAAGHDVSQVVPVLRDGAFTAG